ncbi:helix-turn-helix transcriptional regulator [Bacillus canaveralius]|uniref:helix-turn-helix transcriptional regulator n=1 Tax=Bacillus canaveralius TaxID=1403243 RepID=UPI000F79F8EC|nr:transcriptional regulator [Bacillus canaveralius]RSK53987.1 transcriptional regulator [Bacillus canaveralius]
MSRIQKVERLFYIITYLNNHASVTAEELAKNCQTSVRSIYRDMKVLEGIGFYYTSEGKKGYRLLTQPVRPSFNLNYDEWMALVLFPLLSGNIAASQHPFHHAYRSGLEKIGKNVRNKKTTPINTELGERILFQDDQYRDPFQPDVMPAIIEAIIGNKSIHVSYYSIHRDATSNRILDPYYLVPRGGHLYLIAFCHFRQEVRVFRLSRIRSIEVTENLFKIPRTFNISHYLANRWSILAEDPEPTSFVVRFQKDVVRYIYEKDFYTDTTLTEQEDGSLLLKTKVKSKAEFLKWIRSFGLHVEVLEPEEVRKLLKSEYEQMLHQYES